MAAEWRGLTLGDLCDAGVAHLQTGPFGTQLHAHDYVEDGVPVVPTEAIRNRQIDHSVLPEISIGKANELARHRLEPGDILFARRGVQATGHIGFIREAEDGFLCGTGAIRLRVRSDTDFLDPDFLSHVLANPASVRWFKFHAIGATMPNLNEGIIRSFPLQIPPLPEQRAIAYVLSTLDDKIELNRRYLDVLRLTARTQAGATFVEGDPRPLGSLATLQRGFGYRSEGFGPNGTQMISMGSAERRGWLKRSGVRSYAEPVKAKYFVGPWDLLVVNVDLTWKLDVLGWPLIVPKDLGSAVISNDVFALRFHEAARWLKMVTWAYLQTREARSIIEGVAKGTTVASIAGDDLLSLEVPVPKDAPQINRLEQAADLIERGWLAELESSTLVELRDTLLPKLVSGALRISEAERLLGIAAV